jgi:hypothetical protein
MVDVDAVLGKRRLCSRCKRRRKVCAVWQDTGYMLCRPCALIPGMAFEASLRKVTVITA